ncbi:MAG: DEAD/DEAH box helicase family protein, partial [Terriglobia bacterium]
MELKEYQQTALDQVKTYLDKLTEWRKRSEKDPESEIDFAQKAWEKATKGKSYHVRKDGLGRPLPNFCLKIPTGGGKTLLAAKAIDLINTTYLHKRTGIVLWIVPSEQIYSQTIRSLRDREHPYRQTLDIASGGRTLILEKADRFSPGEVQENLAILMLMLPSANRLNKETLKVFKDTGGFQDFFPLEDDIQGHADILKQVRNLDYFGSGDGFWGRQVKTSLGNTLRLLSPIIILDEGHRAYSEGAQQTLFGFNPSIIVELSATPTEQSNVLVKITGLELLREDMIKLDLHLVNKASPDWKDTLLAAVNQRDLLEREAKDYHANTNTYIRPICLIQVERTGKDQRGAGKVHAEDVREWLVLTHGIPAEQVAVKSHQVNELKDEDDIGGLM